MTDGTSQGLFIVTAIVIFGIFVVLAYILFEDTLSPAMANMFTAATEQANDQLNDKSLITMNTLKDRYSTTNYDRVDYSWRRDKITLSGDDLWMGIYIPDDILEGEKEYEAIFDIKLVEGEMKSLGGHIKSSDHNETYINGELVDWNWAAPAQTDMFEVGKTYKVKVLFNTNLWDEPEYGVYDRNFYIQPNRILQDIYSKVEIRNVRLYEK